MPAQASRSATRAHSMRKQDGNPGGLLKPASRDEHFAIRVGSLASQVSCKYPARGSRCPSMRGALQSTCSRGIYSHVARDRGTRQTAAARRSCCRWCGSPRACYADGCELADHAGSSPVGGAHSDLMAHYRKGVFHASRARGRRPEIATNARGRPRSRMCGARDATECPRFMRRIAIRRMPTRTAMGGNVQ